MHHTKIAGIQALFVCIVQRDKYSVHSILFRTSIGIRVRLGREEGDEQRPTNHFSVLYIIPLVQRCLFFFCIHQFIHLIEVHKANILSRQWKLYCIPSFLPEILSSLRVGCVLFESGLFQLLVCLFLYRAVAIAFTPPFFLPSFGSV